MGWSNDGIRNARITRTDLGYHDGFGSIKNAWVHLDYGDSGQGFGGQVLGGAYTDAFIYGLLEALECESWEKLPGQFVRVDIREGLARRIGHPLKDQWFDPKATAKSLGLTP